jgi:hypothetical protein
MTQRHVANIALRQQQQCSNEQRSRVVYPQKQGSVTDIDAALEQ